MGLCWADVLTEIFNLSHAQTSVSTCFQFTTKRSYVTRLNKNKIKINYQQIKHTSHIKNSILDTINAQMALQSSDCSLVEFKLHAGETWQTWWPGVAPIMFTSKDKGAAQTTGNRWDWDKKNENLQIVQFSQFWMSKLLSNPKFSSVRINSKLLQVYN